MSRVQQVQQALHAQCGLRARIVWLESVGELLSGTNISAAAAGSGRNVSIDEWCTRAYEMALCADLKSISEGVLDAGVNASTKRFLKDKYLVQIESSRNVAVPVYKYEEIMIGDQKNDGGRGRSNERKHTPKRMLKLHLTDGKHQVIGMEYQVIPNLPNEPKPGTKLLISDVRVREGILMLHGGNTQVLDTLGILDDNSETELGATSSHFNNNGAASGPQRRHAASSTAAAAAAAAAAAPQTAPTHTQAHRRTSEMKQPVRKSPTRKRAKKEVVKHESRQPTHSGQSGVVDLTNDNTSGIDDLAHLPESILFDDDLAIDLELGNDVLDVDDMLMDDTDAFSSTARTLSGFSSSATTPQKRSHISSARSLLARTTSSTGTNAVALQRKRSRR
jgi:RMI1, N-terminal OB-fold domain